MHNIEIYFVGGTHCLLVDVSEECANKLVEWLDNKEDTSTFKVNIPSSNKTKVLRKELILFVDII